MKKISKETPKVILDEFSVWDANPDKGKFIAYLTGEDCHRKGLFEMFSTNSSFVQKHTFKMGKPIIAKNGLDEKDK